MHLIEQLPSPFPSHDHDDASPPELPRHVPSAYNDCRTSHPLHLTTSTRRASRHCDRTRLSNKCCPPPPPLRRSTCWLHLGSWYLSAERPVTRTRVPWGLQYWWRWQTKCGQEVEIPELGTGTRDHRLIYHHRPPRYLLLNRTLKTWRWSVVGKTGSMVGKMTMLQIRSKLTRHVPMHGAKANPCARARQARRSTDDCPELSGSCRKRRVAHHHARRHRWTIVGGRPLDQSCATTRT
jgi:hypothetical protein